ncbi:type IV pilus assembly protein PilO [Desulfuromusa kysingii]|uniref:Type IV pilus assembly protein PilO n=1 Tax=Desulfuromusa kysingii TaxID=37625 RepID=A0A1H4CXU6_9BACT|nr:type 4a pilus biogenesis protein PilO [Desulfuromusa kysingii]SEA65217.1 type IV pilus assembly protein PilO [Desulfuromusa kysingii]
MNAQVEKVLNLPSYQRTLIVLLIMAVLAAAFYFVMYKPQLDQYSSLISKRDSAQTKLQKNQKIANNLDVYRAEYEKMQIKLNKALGELPLQKEIPSLLTNIGELAKEKGLDILRFKPSGEKSQGFYADVPVALKLTGSFHQAAAFFDAVSKMERIVNVQNLTLGGAKDIDGKTSLSVDCNALTFRFVENYVEPKGKKGGKRK